MIQGNDRLQIERHISVCIIVNISSGISLTIPNLYFGEKNIFLYNNDHLSMIEYGNRVVYLDTQEVDMQSTTIIGFHSSIPS